MESLIPSGSNGDDSFKKAAPPSNIPFAEDDGLEYENKTFIPEAPIQKEAEPSRSVNFSNQFVAPGPKNPNPEPHRTIDPHTVQSAPQVQSQTRKEEPKAQPKIEKEKTDFIFYLDVDKITPNPDQPRRHFSEDAIRELASSIRQFGILQPIVVTKKVKDTEYGTEVEYVLIAGERRLRAVKLLGLPTIPAIIRNVDLERERLELAVIENLQREDLNVIEVARSYARLQDEFRMTQREVAAKLGKSRESVANTLRLLDLPIQIQEALAEGRLSESHGRLLLTLGDPAAQQRLFEEILQKPMTTRELRNKVQVLAHGSKEEVSRPGLPAEMKMLQERLTSELGAPVLIEQHGETGKITIRFYSPEELQQIISKLAKEQEF